MLDIQLVVEDAPPEYYRFASQVRVDFVIDPGHRHSGVTADLAPFGFARKGFITLQVMPAPASR